MMKYEKNDVNELCKSIGIKVNSYIEIKEDEATVRIKNKWPLVDRIILFCNQNTINPHDKIT